MKDYLSKEERKLLSNKLMMNENCDVVDFIDAINRRLLRRLNAYKEFLAQFKDGFVNYKELQKSLEEVKELSEMKTLCMSAYKKQKDEIALLLIEYRALLGGIRFEED